MVHTQKCVYISQWDKTAGQWLRQEKRQKGDFPFSGVQGVLMRDLNQVTPGLGVYLELKMYLKGG